MLYLTIQHYDASQTEEKLRLIPGSKRRPWKVMTALSGVMSLRKWLSVALRVTLIGALVISGCSSKDSGEHSEGQGKLTQQEPGSAATNPVHKEVGEASLVWARSSGPRDRQWRDL
jgi:hypothetical protein